MSICNGCGGVVGRDCFNPSECEWISRDIEMRRQQQYCEARSDERITELERQLVEYRTKHDVACSTLEIVKEQRTAAQKALAEQCKQTKQLERQNEGLREALQWISVDDHLPPPDADVLVRVLRHGNQESFDVAGLFYGEWASCATEANTKGVVTHWRAIEPFGHTAAAAAHQHSSSRIGGDKGPCNCGADRTTAVGTEGRDYETRHAIMEAECNAATEEYFKARPQLDFIGNRRIFESGFQRGFERRPTTNSAAHQEGAK